MLASAAALALALAATHGVIDRIHDHAAHMRTTAHPAGAAGFAEGNIFVLDIADLADGGVALGENLADFTGGQTHLGVTGVDRHDRRAAAGGAADLRAASGNDFDIVNRRAERNVFERKGVADDRFGFRTAAQRGSDREADRSDDVALLAVGIFEQGDVRRA